MSCGYGAISAPIYFWRGLFTNIKQSKALYWGIFRQKVKMFEFRIAPKQKNLPIKVWNNKKALISSIMFFKATNFVRTFVLYRRGEGICSELQKYNHSDSEIVVAGRDYYYRFSWNFQLPTILCCYISFKNKFWNVGRCLKLLIITQQSDDRRAKSH